MGFKKTNYKLEKIGLTLPTAYALIGELKVQGERAKAVFNIHVTREEAAQKKPIEQKVLWFNVDRNENPFVTAYKKAKESTETVTVDEETGEEKTVEKKGIFADWTDDIV
jgi:hypothetical protein